MTFLECDFINTQAAHRPSLGPQYALFDLSVEDTLSCLIAQTFTAYSLSDGIMPIRLKDIALIAGRVASLEGHTVQDLSERLATIRALEPPMVVFQVTSQSKDRQVTLDPALILMGYARNPLAVGTDGHIVFDDTKQDQHPFALVNFVAYHIQVFQTQQRRQRVMYFLANFINDPYTLFHPEASCGNLVCCYPTKSTSVGLFSANRLAH
jgi:hypothetical protein